MERQTVIDEDGVWVSNTGNFTFTDPTTMIRHEPGTRTKCRITDWLLTQPVMAFDGKEEAIAARVANTSVIDKAAEKVEAEAVEAAARVAKELAEAEARAADAAKKTTK